MISSHSADMGNELKNIKNPSEEGWAHQSRYNTTTQKNEEWGVVAKGWTKWWKEFEDQGACHVSQRLVELAGIQEGERVLDLATGYGEPAITAALKVGKQGYVLGIDASKQMLAIARARARAYGLNNVSFINQDIECAKLTEDSFQSAVCRWGIMFFRNPESTLRQVHDSLVRGGTFTAAVWSSPSKVPLLTLPFEAARLALQEEIGAQDDDKIMCNKHGPFSLSDADILRKIFEKAGFSNIMIERLPLIFEVASANIFAEATLELSAPLQALIARFAPNQRKDIATRIVNTIGEITSQYRVDDSPRIQLENEVIVTVGCRNNGAS